MSFSSLFIIMQLGSDIKKRKSIEHSTHPNNKTNILTELVSKINNIVMTNSNHYIGRTKYFPFHK